MHKKTPRGLLLIFFVLFFMACSDSDDRIEQKELPNLAQAYLKTYLPKSQILQVENVKSTKDGQEKYKVTLSKQITVLFDESGNWLQVEGESTLPQSILNSLDEEELIALKANYPALDFIKISNTSLYRFRREVTLLDHTQLVLYYKLGTIYIATSLKENKVPSFLYDFIEAYYNNVAIEYILQVEEEGEKVFKVYMTTETKSKEHSAIDDQVELVFNQEGEWLSVEHNKTAIPQKLYQTISDYAQEYMAEKYSSLIINSIVKQDEYYGFGVFTNDIRQTIFVSKEASPVFRFDVVQRFIWEHFNPNYQSSSTTIRRDKTKRYYITHQIKSEEGFIKLEANINGDWVVLETIDRFIPLSVLETLPKEVKELLDSKALSQWVDKIVKSENGAISIYAKDEKYVFGE